MYSLGYHCTNLTEHVTDWIFQIMDFIKILGQLYFTKIIQSFILKIENVCQNTMHSQEYTNIFKISLNIYILKIFNLYN